MTTIYQRTRMDKIDEEVIQEHAEEIEKVVEARDITPCLFARMIIDSDDKEDINRRKTRVRRARRLIDILILRSSKAFSGFVSALRSKGYHHLATKLSQSRKGRNNEPRRTDSTSSSQTWEGEQHLTENVAELQETFHGFQNNVDERFEKTDDKLEEVTVNVKEIKDILQKLEEQSRINKETKLTIADLRTQLEQKEKLLNQARERIDQLEKSLEEYKEENAKLKHDLTEYSKFKKSMEEEKEENRKFREETRRLFDALQTQKKNKPGIQPRNRFQ